MKNKLPVYVYNKEQIVSEALKRKNNESKILELCELSVRKTQKYYTTRPQFHMKSFQTI